MLLHTFRARSNCENEAKFIQNRIQFTERNLSDLSNIFSQYSHKAGSIRDKTDEISKTILHYAESENINKSLSLGLESFSDSLSLLCEYGDKRVHALDSKVVVELAKYKEICKHAKEEVKEIYTARDKELNRKKNLDKIREKNPRNRQQIIQAETELVKATAKVSKSIHNLEEKTTNFEKQKLHDIKSTLLDFIAIEVAYHVNSLEALTQAYNHIESIDEESDLEDFHKFKGQLESDFQKSLRLPADNVYPKSPRRTLFGSKGKFGSLGALFAPSHNKNNSHLTKSKDKFLKSEEKLQTQKHQHLSEDESDDSSEVDLTEEAIESSSENEEPKNSVKGVRQRK